MELQKNEKMTLSLLVNIQSELLTIKDYILKSIEIVGEGTKEERAKKLIENYEEDRKYYQKSIIASLKNNFDESLGSINDLLNNL
ncbi:MAG TPA: hypothetical protein VIL78_17950 [Hanamia sp.]